MSQKILFITIFFLSLFTLQATPNKKKIERFPLLQTKWILDDINNTNIFFDSDTAFIVFFENYTFSGNFGCNTFYGNFTHGKKRIKLDYLGSSKKLCTNMKVEELFFKAIKSDISHYYIDKNKLYLLYKLNVVCKFRCDEKK